jgi:hypothetical protein
MIPLRCGVNKYFYQKGPRLFGRRYAEGIALNSRGQKINVEYQTKKESIECENWISKLSFEQAIRPICETPAAVPNNE